MNILITICGRGGSKGLPGKNVRLLNGKPLLSFSVDVAKRFSEKYHTDIALSTDDNEIKKVAEQFGLQTTYSRPEYLAIDTAGKIETIAHLLFFEEKNRNKHYDFVLDLDITSPLRTLKDLKEAFKIIKADNNALNLFSVNPANRNPYFNMVEQRPSGYFGLIKNGEFVTRQSSPKVYDMNASFYFFRRAFFNNGNTTVITDRSLIYEMPHICFDLDRSIDFEFMEYLIENHKLNFQL